MPLNMPYLIGQWFWGSRKVLLMVFSHAWILVLRYHRPQGPHLNVKLQVLQTHCDTKYGRSAKARVSLKLCRSNLAKEVNIIHTVHCTKTLYGLHRRCNVIITNIFLLLGHLQCISSVCCRQYKGLLCCPFAHVFPLLTNIQCLWSFRIDPPQLCNDWNEIFMLK